jgi:hypothetical protein
MVFLGGGTHYLCESQIVTSGVLEFSGACEGGAMRAKCNAGAGEVGGWGMLCHGCYAWSIKI